MLSVTAILENLGSKELYTLLFGLPCFTTLVLGLADLLVVTTRTTDLCNTVTILRHLRVFKAKCGEKKPEVH